MKDVLDALSTITRKELYHRQECPVNSWIFGQYQEFMKSGKYPYLKDVADFIKAQLPPLDATQTQNLDSQVYYASRRYRDEQEQTRIAAMIAQGWRRFNADTVPEALRFGVKKIILSRKQDGAFGESIKESTYKPFRTEDGRLFLLPPHAKTRGCPAEQFCGSYQGVTLFKYIDEPKPTPKRRKAVSTEPALFAEAAA